VQYGRCTASDVTRDPEVAQRPAVLPATVQLKRDRVGHHEDGHREISDGEGDDEVVGDRGPQPPVGHDRRADEAVTHQGDEDDH